jgi:hypothetical protein
MFIHKFSTPMALLVAMTAAPSAPVQAQGAGPYTPEQVYFVLHDAIMQALQVRQDVPQPVWVSLSTVGAVVETDDKAQVNDLANFCPAPTPVLATFGREPKLDDIYQRVMDAAIGPERPFSEAYFAAKRVLYKPDGAPTDQLAKYRQFQDRYRVAFKNLVHATTTVERVDATAEMNRITQDWRSAGFKQEIESAQNTMASQESRTGVERQQKRRDTLDNYRAAGYAGNDFGIAFVSPASSFSPEPDKWATSTGWVSVAFDSQHDISRYSSETSRKRGFAGLSLGFMSIGGSAGGNRTTVTKLDRVYKLTYQFEIMRAHIRRPWLDTTLLFEPFDWTWRKSTNTTEFPYVAVARSPDGPLQEPAAVLYESKPVACSMLPLDVVVARNRKIVATVSTSDYQNITANSSARGGGSLFGIFGGGGRQSWSLNVINRDANNVTFSVEANGVAVIGFISQPLPQVPSPNAAEHWPREAWLPAPPVAPTPPTS